QAPRCGAWVSTRTAGAYRKRITSVRAIAKAREHHGDGLGERRVVRGATHQHPVEAILRLPFAIRPGRQVIRRLRDEMGERVVGGRGVDLDGDLRAFTRLQVHLLEAYQPL